MTSTVIDSTVLSFTNWGTQIDGDSFLLTQNSVLFAPNVGYFTFVPNIKVTMAGTANIASFSIDSGGLLSIASTGYLALASTTGGIYVGTNAAASLHNYGTIDSNANAVQSSNSGYIYNAGMISAAASGVSMNVFGTAGAGDSLVNDGTITARDFYGVNATTGTAHIVNRGMIEALGNASSGQQAAILTRAITDIDNSGVIHGRNFGIWTTNGGQTCVVHNSGTIIGGAWSFSVNAGFDAVDTIVNTGLMQGAVYTGLGSDLVDNRGGTIRGDVILDSGDDVFRNEGGTFQGTVYGALGADSYYTDDAGLQIVEDAFATDIDTVYASCNFRLGGAIENLNQQGVGDFRGTGNGLSNAITGNDGDNRLSGLIGNDTLIGGFGDDRLIGGAGLDTLIGEDGDDTLYGQSGNDSISAGDGDDLLIGGTGRDSMSGGAGDDLFQFTAAAQGSTSRTTADIIWEFTPGEDRIDLAGIDAKSNNTVPNDAFAFISGAFTSVSGQLHAVQSGGQTYVEGDIDGNGTADFIVRVNGLVTLAAADFIL